MMAHDLHGLWQRGSKVARPLFVGASSLAIAGLLGACASPSPASLAAVPGPSPATGAQATGRLDSLPVIGSLKNAESAVSDYARAWRRESALRENLQAASDAALVARHRQTIAPTDFLATSAAENRLATARREFKAGEAATRVARARLYRAFGMKESGIVPVRAPASAGAPGVEVSPL
jgi:hypothetical protein